MNCNLSTSDFACCGPNTACFYVAVVFLTNKALRRRPGKSATLRSAQVEYNGMFEIAEDFATSIPTAAFKCRLSYSVSGKNSRNGQIEVSGLRRCHLKCFKASSMPEWNQNALDARIKEIVVTDTL